MLALDENDYCHSPNIGLDGNYFCQKPKIGVSLGMLQLSVHFSDKNTVGTAGMPASS